MLSKKGEFTTHLFANKEQLNLRAFVKFLVICDLGRIKVPEYWMHKHNSLWSTRYTHKSNKVMDLGI